MKINISENINDFMKYCNDNQIDIYLVGGFVRDSLLNKPCYDIDVCLTSDYYNALKLLRLKYKVVSDDKYQAIKFKIENYSIEISHARKEKDYLDYRHPSKIEFIDDIKIDSLRRDFTINALYYKDDKIYDFYNGLDDLKNHTLRVINDTLTRFKEDPIRILRMIRFSMNNFNILDSDKKIILKHSYLLKELSISSFEKEFDKILMINNLYVIYEYKDLFQDYYDKKFPDLIKLNNLTTINEKKTYLNIKNKSNLYKYRDLKLPSDKVELNKLIYKFNKDLIKELIVYFDKVNNSDLMSLYLEIIDNCYYDKKNLSLSALKISKLVKHKELVSYYIDKISYLIIEGKLENNEDKIKDYLLNII